MANQNLSFSERRSLSIGGTDVSAIIGVNPYRTALDVYNEKINKEKVEENEYMKVGNFMEDGVAKRFFEETDYTPMKPPKEIIYDKDHSFLHASVDRYIQGYGEVGLLECKTTFKSIESREQFINDHHHYWCQVQWYLGITNLPFAFIAIYSFAFSPTFHYFKIEADPEAFKILKNAAVKFWKENIEKKVLPEAQNTADLLKLYPDHNPDEFVRADIESIKLYEDTKALNEQKRTIEENLSVKKEKLKLIIKDNEGIMDKENDKILCTFKTAKNGSRTLRLK